MTEVILFADKARGIFGHKDGRIFLTERGTFDLHQSPFIVSTPYRIIVKEELDPYFLVFVECGYMYLFNNDTRICENCIQLPSNIGVIESVDISTKDKFKITSSKCTYLFNNGYFQILSEPVDSLVVKEDQRVNGQIAEYENEVQTAILFKDIEMYEAALEKYFFYLAAYSTTDTFISTWYELIKAETPFGHQVLNVYKNMIELLSSIDRIIPFAEEMQISIDKLHINE